MLLAFAYNRKNAGSGVVGETIKIEYQEQVQICNVIHENRVRKAVCVHTEAEI